MTVNEMIMLSRVFLGIMIFFLIAAIVVFFMLDVRKAWRMLTGKKMSVQQRKKEPVREKNREWKTSKLAMESVKHTVEASTEATTLLVTTESINNQYERYHSTTVLAESDEATTVLTNQKDSVNNIVMDITFIHTEITL